MNKTRSILLLAILASLAASCSDVSFVDAVTIVNQTDYPAHVDVSDASREGWLSLALAQADAETVVPDVIDQGELWVFRFEYGGRHQEQLELSRSDLVKTDWKVEVPRALEDSLQELDIEPPR
ncbi:MAG: hypothetical protein M3346_06260 [Actinomycetota bacterium]|nr:hypothetical protein [Actinomycetota bacterium]